MHIAGEESLPECEACRTGIGEPWEKFVRTLAGASPRQLEKAYNTWHKRAIDYHMAGCTKHEDEASDRRDYISVLKDGLFSSSEITHTQWIEGRRRLRKESEPQSEK